MIWIYFLDYEFCQSLIKYFRQKSSESAIKSLCNLLKKCLACLFLSSFIGKILFCLSYLVILIHTEIKEYIKKYNTIHTISRGISQPGNLKDLNIIAIITDVWRIVVGGPWDMTLEHTVEVLSMVCFYHKMAAHWRRQQACKLSMIGDLHCLQ